MRRSLLYNWIASKKQQQSAFDNLWGRWRADSYTGSNPTISLTDLSGNGRTMTQVAGTLTPGTAANGQARMTGNAMARLSCSATIKRWPITVITVGRRASGATCGFFGHTGASPFNSMWCGYESTNRFFLYNTNGSSNTTTDAGADACWIQRTGYGTRTAIVNGIIQADMTQSSMVRGSAVAVDIGTQYRGLNLDWYECLVWDRVLSLSELDEVHTYINTRYSMSIPLWSSYTQCKVIRLRGQSNASGRGDRGALDINIPAEYDTALTGVNVWNGTVTGLVGDAYATLNVNSNNHMLGENNTPTQAATYFGPELTLTKEYIDRVGGVVYLNKWALGSTPLAVNGANFTWNALDETLTQLNSNKGFNVEAKNWWVSIRVHQLAGRVPVVIGDIWFQGEQDAMVQSWAEAYSTNLVNFFDTSDKEAGVSGRKFICRIHINGSEVYESTVRSQQATAASLISGATLIDTDSYGTRIGDGVHLSFQGQLDLGTYLSTLL